MRKKQKEEEKKSLGARAIDTLSGIFTPILQALTAAGMLKAVISLFVALKLVSSDQQSYQILNFMGDATFYFLPILLVHSAAKKFKCNLYLAMMLGSNLIKSLKNPYLKASEWGWRDLASAYTGNKKIRSSF